VACCAQQTGIHINDHTHERVCRHPLCGDFIADEHALRQHLVHEHGLSNSRPDAVSSRKRKPSDELEFLEWTPEDGLSSSKRTRFAISTINPRVLSEPTPAGYRADETECLTDSESDETLLDGCITGAVGSQDPQYSLKDGDVVEVEIQPIGILRNKMCFVN